MRASRSLSSTGSTATRKKRSDAGRTAVATDDKYGRQLLRLWGANGQAALMGAHVLLLRGADGLGDAQEPRAAGGRPGGGRRRRHRHGEFRREVPGCRLADYPNLRVC